MVYNMNKNRVKIFWKPFLFIFLLSFVILNWNDISPFLNYKLISGELGKIFQKNEKNSFLAQAAKEKFPEEGIIEIPEIGVKAPIVFTQEENLTEALKRGVVHYPQSVLPGEKGIAIILGHSAPPNWPKIDYDWVFSRLNELNSGDKISVGISDQKYIYKVTKKIFFNSGEEISTELTNSKSVLFLISCWPPGKNFKRIGVQAQLI